METNGIENPRIASENDSKLQKKDSITDKMIGSESIKPNENNKVLEKQQSESNDDQSVNKHNSESPVNKQASDDEAADLLDGLKLNASKQHPEQLPSTEQTVAPTSSKRLKTDHPLKHQWTFWYLNAKKEMSWLDRLKNVCTITTIEEFWALFDNIRPPSSLASGCDYNFFREGIKPVWEVPENKNGGRLLVQIDKGRNENLDACWLELILTLVGEQFQQDTEQISGAVCMARQKGSKICLWTQDAQNEDVNRRIGIIMKNRFSEATKSQVRVSYEEHNAAQNKMSSAIQSRFVL